MGALLAATTLLAAAGAVQAGDGGRPGSKRYRGLLGPDNKKVKHDGEKTLLWAGPPGTDPSSPEAQWYDFTGASIPPAELQFGIGKDGIRAIDDPLFVAPDDPRLLKLGHDRFRREEKQQSSDDIRVIGVTGGGDVRAYPVALLNGHELVNDRIGGKPVTVGW